MRLTIEYLKRGNFEITGWMLFVASALLFCAASWRANDMVALAGSLLFLAACFFFLYPKAIGASPDQTKAE